MNASIKSATQVAAAGFAKVLVHPAGSFGLLLDAAQREFSQITQEKIWVLAKLLKEDGVLPGVRETVPGINNLLVVFEPTNFFPIDATEHLLSLWANLEVEQRTGLDIEIPVTYGGEYGEDLAELAGEAGLQIADYVKLHSSATYSVACIGAYPGFAFMTGLPPQLAKPRRKTPRLKVSEGAVIIGGQQAGVLPCTAPSGWHLLGTTDVKVFDATNPTPCLFAAGDRVHFRIRSIEK
ncbi:5-oxoprolinase subunit PxpB [Herbaspirillum sp. 1130]|uniref:5-oxoprolinase subunit PxpB n=1 Tax=Herbaspirillum sp. 1130 TaxID=2806562 RepID=UPI001AEAA397|nr:5-oxoprolinase subunit PxpB [Herbaspirillum sp. 1130]MBP1318305.1 KipI family sensor histidine kinase inhibitor [Herbaspirillum sp. 1130]